MNSPAENGYRNGNKNGNKRGLIQAKCNDNKSCKLLSIKEV